MFEIVIFGVVFVIVMGIFAAMNKQEEIRKALEAYQASLRQLKSAPANAELREQALRLGRVYSNLTRNNKGVTTFDEMALKNDLDAACAGRGHLQDSSVEERLAKLQRLCAAGHIDEQEQGRRRQSIIDEV